MTTYASVCSGIESPSVAWGILGWEPIWFSEIEPNASKVLKHHHTEVPNLGDMTLIAGMIDRDEIQAPDILVGGTPCQAFSVAGLRNGLNDDRGNLTLVFAHLIESCDNQRKRNGLEPIVVVWENVKGVLSDKTNAFGNYISLLVGEDEEIKRPDGKWTNAGCVFGPKRAIAWRVLDAQHFGVPQRRKRVFLIGSARKGFRPHEVLFEFEGLRRDSAPSRETWKDDTCGTEASIGSGGSLMNLQPSENLANVVQRSQCQAISVRLANTSSNGCGFQQETNHTLDRAGPNAVFVDVYNQTSHGDTCPPLTTATGVSNASGGKMLQYNQVRKLTPTECERLMGFPDGYTSILADSNRYKVLGNSIVTNCLKWIGNRMSSVV